MALLTNRRYRKCLILLFILLVSQVVYIYIHYNYPTKATGDKSVEARPEKATRAAFSVASDHTSLWKPNNITLDQVFDQLNLTKQLGGSQLPLTLHGPFLLSNDSLCVTQDGSPIDILFFVHTATGNFERRERLRRTVMAEENLKPFQVKVRRLFLVGRVKEPLEQARLEQEHASHGDLVQADFLDTYHNLSHKGVMGYRWVTLHCPRVRLLVKMDDDVFIDTFKLVQHYWGPFTMKSRAIMCNVWKKNDMAVLRSGKWKVDMHLFRGKKAFPYHYCSGMVVIMTGDVVPSLLQAAAVTPVFWIDDVYLFGMLPAVASGVTFYTTGPEVLELNREKALTCLDTKGDGCPFLATGAANGQEFDPMWNKTQTIHRANQRWPERVERV